jgi:hypothetical protein
MQMNTGKQGLEWSNDRKKSGFSGGLDSDKRALCAQRSAQPDLTAPIKHGSDHHIGDADPDPTNTESCRPKREEETLEGGHASARAMRASVGLATAASWGAAGSAVAANTDCTAAISAAT